MSGTAKARAAHHSCYLLLVALVDPASLLSDPLGLLGTLQAEALMGPAVLGLQTHSGLGRASLPLSLKGEETVPLQAGVLVSIP